jgi:hypothetical protein
MKKVFHTPFLQLLKIHYMWLINAIFYSYLTLKCVFSRANSPRKRFHLGAVLIRKNFKKNLKKKKCTLNKGVKTNICFK